MAGRPVLVHAILAFVATRRFTDIMITVPEHHIDRVRGLLGPHLDTRALLFEEGGPTRQESVYRGLLGLVCQAPEAVLIHDGARPWVDADTIVRVLEGVRKWGACLPVTPSADAVMEVDEQGVVLRHMDRRRTFCAQTPQGFEFNRIVSAHREAAQAARAGENGFVDDGEVFAAYAGAVHTVAGSLRNRKVTFLHDLTLHEEMS